MKVLLKNEKLSAQEVKLRKEKLTKAFGKAGACCKRVVAKKDNIACGCR